MTAQAARVRIGMIGAGFIAGYHLDGLRAAGGADVRVIAGRGLKNAAALAARHGIADATADWRAVLARDDIDAVVITTPDDTHPEIAIAAAQAGKHILLQKPMARTADECRRIIAAANAAGVHLQVSFMHRYFEETVRTRELLADGAIGRPYALRMRNATPGPDWGAWFYSRARVGGGVVMQLGVHGIDLLRHLCGDIGQLSAQTALLRTERTLADGSVVHPDNEDHALALYRFDSGAIASHEMSMSEVAGCDRFTLEIYGESGTIWLRSGRGPLAIHAPRYTGTKEWVCPTLPAREFGARQHQAFLDIVRGTAAPDTTAADGLASVLVAEAIYQSAELRREVAVGKTEGPR
ncbi:MAG: Gfo/Idh/MocA family oxidoreductase [Betaproteobacteria bacterium]|nr:Gfo/Idh/MocA family oxidoreductase [Betaproteobacteria bacterium]